MSSKSESVSGAPTVLRIYSPGLDNAHTWTGISISSKDTSLQRVLELACQKQRIPQPYNNYALLLVLSTALPARVGHAGDFSATIAAPLNKTVATLPHALEGLTLLPRSGADLLATPHRNLYLPVNKGGTDQNMYYLNNVVDYAAVYKKYTVHECQRPAGLKRFLSGGTRRKRALIINGDQLQIIHSTERLTIGVLGNSKTAATPELYNLSSISMSQSLDNASAFTVEVLQNGSDAPQGTSLEGPRRLYEFEATDPKKVDELLRTVKTLQMLWGPNMKQSEKEPFNIQRYSSISTASTLGKGPKDP